MNPIIIPTVVPAGPEDISAARARYSFAQSIHVDVTDGEFAPTKTWMPPPGYKLPDNATVEYEVHLMAENPLSLGLAYAHAGAKRMIGHVETFGHSDGAQDTFSMWRGSGVRAIGIALLLETSPKDIIPFVELIDFVHVMTIAEIGAQGQPFDERALERIARVHAQYPELVISVDGGVNADRIPELARAGVSRFCVGKALAAAPNPEALFNALSALCTPAA